jgi:ribbon-helix-helix protein, copG family
LKGVDKVSPKMGQKIKDNPKDFMLRTRLDEETLEKLDYSAEKFNVSRSEIVRRGIEDEYQKAQKNKNN